ncbi:MAG: DUF72 domain-containing protein [Ignavibacteria bacterium]|nr:DUF72 domain-containing protein [Ignavibacteria bacterium]
MKRLGRDIQVGMGGWDLPPFHKYFYPPRPRKGFRALEFYSQFFDFVEINSTFYNTLLGPQHSRSWLRDVEHNKHFVFTVKLYRGFTHSYTAVRKDFLSVLRLLEPLVSENRFAGLVIQFPHSFSNIRERREYLRHLARGFRPHTLFLEVRHDSWNTPLMVNFFQESHLHLINVDLPPIRHHMPLTSISWGGVGYYRLMGRNERTWFRSENGNRYLYCYSEEELHHLWSLMEESRAQNDRIFVVFHNDPEANSLVNGFQLRHLLRKKRVLVPQHLIDAYPTLKPISSAVNVLHPLFADTSSPDYPSSGMMHSRTSF